MASAKLEDIIRRAEALTPDEQIELITHLVYELAQRTDAGNPAHRDWSEIHGIAPDLLEGEDAQEWVSRGRREADEDRKYRGNGTA
jgi:hypothetical protein